MINEPADTHDIVSRAMRTAREQLTGDGHTDAVAVLDRVMFDLRDDWDRQRRNALYLEDVAANRRFRIERELDLATSLQHQASTVALLTEIRDLLKRA